MSIIMSDSLSLWRLNLTLNPIMRFQSSFILYTNYFSSWVTRRKVLALSEDLRLQLEWSTCGLPHRTMHRAVLRLLWLCSRNQKQTNLGSKRKARNSLNLCMKTKLTVNLTTRKNCLVTLKDLAQGNTNTDNKEGCNLDLFLAHVPLRRLSPAGMKPHEDVEAFRYKKKTWSQTLHRDIIFYLFFFPQL